MRDKSPKNKKEKSKSVSIPSNVVNDIRAQVPDLDEFEDMIEKDANTLITYDADCIRKRSNWTISSNAFKFDNVDFNPTKLLKDMTLRSPKMTELLKHIKEIDAADMKRDGRHYKHFIFSDLKNGLYGAKLIAAAFIASGYNLGYTAKPSKVGSQKDFTKIELLNDAVLAKTAFNNFYLLSSVGVFDQPIATATKKAILKKYNDRPGNIYGKDIRFIIMDSGFKEGIDLFDVKYIHIFEPQTTAADQKQVIGRGTRTCGQKGLVFNPKQGWPLYVFNYDLTIAPKYQETFYDSKTSIELYLKSVGIDFRLFTFASDLEKATILGSVDYELNKKIHEFSINNSTSKSKSKSKSRSKSKSKSKSKSLANISRTGGSSLSQSPNIKSKTWKVKRCPKGQKRSKTTKKCKLKRCAEGTHRDSKTKKCVKYQRKYKSKPKYNSLADISKASISYNSSVPSKHSSIYDSFRDPFAPDMEAMNFNELRNYISDHFSKHSWDNVKMENMCGYAGPSIANTSIASSNTINKKGGGKTDLINFTPTQDFIRNYFTVNNPVRGMLLWHSVGTGKTCSAIAAATTAFEPLGYTILWVTRTTLKNDIWKNMFDQVCHEKFRQDRIKNTPDDNTSRMRMLSKSWSIRPMSYKQFSNLVSKKNSLYDDLVKKNGSADPLRKTLLVIDEAHKLYGGTDLSSLERPDMNALHKALMNSYIVSGSKSVKVLLMTATPITNNPMELIKLLNLTKLPQNQMPTDFDAFAGEYLSVDNGTFTTTGQKKYLNDIAGHVSYLNRERDARQFAQPHIQPIRVPMVSPQVANMISTLDKRMAKQIIEAEVAPLVAEQKRYQKQLNGDLKDISQAKFAFIDAKMCKKLEPKDKTECKEIVKSHVADIMHDLQNRKDEIKKSLATLKDQMSKIKDAHKISGKVDAEEMKQYKQTTFYNLKYTCGTKSTSESQLMKNIKAHPTMIAMDDYIADLESNTTQIKADLTLQISAYKNRVLQLKEDMRASDDKSEVNRIQQIIQFEKEQASKFATNQTKIVKVRTALLNKTRKNMITRKSKILSGLRKHFKKTLKAEKKQEIVNVKQLQKERRDVQKNAKDNKHLQDETLKQTIQDREQVIMDEIHPLLQNSENIQLERERNQIQKGNTMVRKELIKTRKHKNRVRKKAEIDHKRYEKDQKKWKLKHLKSIVQTAKSKDKAFQEKHKTRKKYGRVMAELKKK